MKRKKIKRRKRIDSPFYFVFLSSLPVVRFSIENKKIGDKNENHSYSSTTQLNLCVCIVFNFFYWYSSCTIEIGSSF